MVLVGSTLDHYLDPNPWTSQKTYYSDVCHKVEAFCPTISEKEKVN